MTFCRASSHDWKRSVRLEGRTFLHWISIGRYKLCDKTCACKLCTDSASSKQQGGKATGEAASASASSFSSSNDRDSDSGVSSVASYAKALIIDTGGSNDAGEDQEEEEEVFANIPLEDDTDYLAAIQVGARKE